MKLCRMVKKVNKKVIFAGQRPGNVRKKEKMRKNMQNKKSGSTKELDFRLERAMGIEPTSSAWKADILADVRCPHRIAREIIP